MKNMLLAHPVNDGGIYHIKMTEQLQSADC